MLANVAAPGLYEDSVRKEVATVEHWLRCIYDAIQNKRGTGGGTAGLAVQRRKGHGPHLYRMLYHSII